MSGSYWVSYDFGTGFVVEWSAADSKSLFIPWKNVNGTRSPLTIADDIPLEDIESKSGRFSKVRIDSNTGSESPTSPESYFFRVRGGLLLYFRSSKDVMPIGAIPLPHCMLSVPVDGAASFDEDSRKTSRRKDRYEIKLTRTDSFSILLLFSSNTDRSEWAEYLSRYLATLNHATVSAKSLFEYAATVSRLEGGLLVNKRRGKSKSNIDAKDSYSAFGSSKKWMYLNWGGPPGHWHLLLSPKELPPQYFSSTDSTEATSETRQYTADCKAYPLADIALCRLNSEGNSFSIYIRTENLLVDPYCFTPVNADRNGASNCIVWVQGVSDACKLRIQLIENSDEGSDNDSTVGNLHTRDFREQFLFTERNVARRGSKKRSSQKSHLPSMADIISGMSEDDARKIEADQREFDRATNAKSKQLGRHGLSSLWRKKDQVLANRAENAPRGRGPQFMPSVDGISLVVEDPISALSASNDSTTVKQEVVSVGFGNSMQDPINKSDDSAEMGDQNKGRTIFHSLKSRKTTENPVVVNRKPAPRKSGVDVDPRKLFVPPNVDTSVAENTFADDAFNEDSPSRRISKSHYNWQNPDCTDTGPFAVEKERMADLEAPATSLHPTGVESGGGTSQGFDSNHATIVDPVLGSRKQVRSVGAGSNVDRLASHWKNNPSRLSSFFGVFSSSRFSSGLSSNNLTSSEFVQDSTDQLSELESERGGHSFHISEKNPQHGLRKIIDQERESMQRITEEDTNDDNDDSTARHTTTDINTGGGEVGRDKVSHLAPKSSLFRSIVNSFIRGDKKLGSGPQKDHDHASELTNSRDVEDQRSSNAIAGEGTVINISVGRGAADGRAASPFDNSSDGSETDEVVGDSAAAILGPISPHAMTVTVPKKKGLFRSFKRSGQADAAQDDCDTGTGNPLNQAAKVSSSLVKSSSINKKRRSTLRDFGDLVIPGGDGGYVSPKRDSFFTSSGNRRASLSSASLLSFSSPMAKGRFHVSGGLDLDNHMEEWEHAVAEQESVRRNTDLDDRRIDTLHVIAPAEPTVRDLVSNSVCEAADENGSSEFQHSLTDFIPTTHHGATKRDGSDPTRKDLVSSKKDDSECSQRHISADVNSEPASLHAGNSSENVAEVNTINYQSMNTSGDDTSRSALSRSFDESDAVSLSREPSFRNRYTKTMKNVSALDRPSNVQYNLARHRKGVVVGLIPNDSKILKVREFSNSTSDPAFVVFRNYGSSVFDSGVSSDDEAEWFSGNMDCTVADIALKNRSMECANGAERHTNHSVGFRIAEQSWNGGSFLHDVQREYKPTSRGRDGVVPSEKEELDRKFVGMVADNGSSEFIVPVTTCMEYKGVELSSTNLGRAVRKRTDLHANETQRKLESGEAPVLRIESTPTKSANTISAVARGSAHFPPRARHYSRNPNVHRSKKEVKQDENLIPNQGGSDYKSENLNMMDSKLMGPSKFLSGVGKYLFSDSEKRSPHDAHDDSVLTEPTDKSVIARQQKKEIMELLGLAKHNAAVQESSSRTLRGVKEGTYAHPISVLYEEGATSFGVKKAPAKSQLPQPEQIYREDPLGTDKQYSGVFTWWNQPPSSEILAESFEDSDIAKSPEKAKVTVPDIVWTDPGSAPERIIDDGSIVRAGYQTRSPKRRHSLGSPMMPRPSDTSSTTNNGTAAPEQLKIEKPLKRDLEMPRERSEENISSPSAFVSQKGWTSLATTNPAVRRESMRRQQRSIEEEDRLCKMRQRLKTKRLHEKKKKLEGELNTKASVREEDVEYILKAQYKGVSVSLFLGKDEIFIRDNNTGQFSTLLFTDILAQEMDGNGSGLFRLKRRMVHSQTAAEEYLTFMAIQPVISSCDDDSVDKKIKKQTHKSSIYVLTQVHQSCGTISVQRTNLSLKDWLTELERRRGVG